MCRRNEAMAFNKNSWWLERERLTLLATKRKRKKESEHVENLRTLDQSDLRISLEEKGLRAHCVWYADGPLQTNTLSKTYRTKNQINQYIILYDEVVVNFYNRKVRDDSFLYNKYSLHISQKSTGVIIHCP